MLLHQSSTRRKSCTTCIKAKRRCDLRLPQCSRCASRSAACQYGTPPELQPIATTSPRSTSQELAQTSWHFNIVSPRDSLPTGSGFVIGVTINFDLLDVNSFPFPERTVIRPEQIDFCIGQFTSLIQQLVQQNQSPFIHHDSYQHSSPVVYQDLLGIAAMYSQKSPQNQTIIFSCLDSRVSTLIQSSKASTWSIEEYLVGVQAMIMYEIIRLFDGDIRQRANAERDLQLLETWTLQLNLMSNTHNSDYTGSSYQRWVFIESIRRTVLMSIMVQAMYSLTKDGYCTSIPLLGSLPMSTDGALWNLSEETWWKTTNGFGGGLITYGDFVIQWSGGENLYTGTFETILIAACRHNLRPTPLMVAA